ncbi:MAG TPA: ACT domain-containing protein [Polyangiales bacterium]|nr:ACT domain-containing protein [Polyangiales bacterium]
MRGTDQDLQTLVSKLEPARHPGVYAYSIAPFDADLGALDPVALIREEDGWTVVAEESQIRRARLPVLFRAAWITLSVGSDLHSVGFTATFSTALAEARISCNVIAGAHHDHVFVPIELADQALAMLHALQRTATGRGAR